MKQYLDLVKTVMEQGSWQENRTGIRTLSMPGAMMRFDLQNGDPVVTTKKTAFKSAVGELVGFLRASDSAAQFRDLGCKVWDQNANENKQWLANPYRLGEDHLGPVYGVQWRQWPAYKVIDLDAPRADEQVQDALSRGYRNLGVLEDMEEEGKKRSVVLYKSIDQLRHCLDTIMSNPGDRRILFHGWNPAVLEQVALPACHLLYMLHPNATTKEISLTLFIRSNDLGLGTPFNLVGGAALLHLIGRLTGYTPKWFTYFIGDAHIYENHLDMLNEQLKREPYESPRIRIAERIPSYAETGVYAPEWLEKVEPSDFILEGYQHHPPLTAPMAV